MLAPVLLFSYGGYGETDMQAVGTIYPRPFLAIFTVWTTDRLSHMGPAAIPSLLSHSLFNLPRVHLDAFIFGHTNVNYNKDFAFLQAIRPQVHIEMHRYKYVEIFRRGSRVVEEAFAEMLPHVDVCNDHHRARSVSLQTFRLVVPLVFPADWYF
jgi:hypothetical protein